MKKGLAIAALITLALVIIGLILAEVVASAGPLGALPPKCSATRKTNCLLYISKSGRPVPNTISASVTEGTVLTINNTASGGGIHKGISASALVCGVYGTGAFGVEGEGSLAGVYGYSLTTGKGVYGYSDSGIGMEALSAYNLPLMVGGYNGTNLVEAWDRGAEPDKLRFAVTRSGLLMVGQLSAPGACGTSTKGAIYYDTDDNKFYGCNGTLWQALN